MEKAKVFMIAGNQGEGKTTFLKSVVSELNLAGIKTAGFYAEGKWKDNLRVSFEIVDIQSNLKRLLCSNKAAPRFEKTGRFYFDPETILWGEAIIAKAKQEKKCLFVLDEIGKFELIQRVWYRVFYDLLQEDLPVLITVRKEMLEKVIQYFKLADPIVFDLDDTKKAAAQIIAERLKF